MENRTKTKQNLFVIFQTIIWRSAYIIKMYAEFCKLNLKS